MSRSVCLYLASGESDGKGFWLVNFTENFNIINSTNSKLLECYRKELFGLKAAIEVKDAINLTLDILVLDIINDGFSLPNSIEGFAFDIPLNVIEDIFDLWAYNYQNQSLWRKYRGILEFRKKIKKNQFINAGLTGTSYKFSLKLENLLSYRPVNSTKFKNKSNKLMW